MLLFRPEQFPLLLTGPHGHLPDIDIFVGGVCAMGCFSLFYLNVGLILRKTEASAMVSFWVISWGCFPQNSTQIPCC